MDSSGGSEKHVEGKIDAALSQVWLEPSPQRSPSSCMHISEAMDRLSIPGIGVAVVADGRLGAVRSFGSKDSTTGTPVDDRTLFQAGSVSKSVAALVALRLVASGDLDLQADINDMLVSWRVPKAGQWQPSLTLKQLLSHTAGLTVHGFPGYPRTAPIPALPQVLSGVPPANSAPVVPVILPGTCFSYSGGGYCVMQQLLVDHTEEAFPQLAQRLVFDPLGMHDSGFEQPLPETRWERAAHGHRVAGVPVEGGWHVYPEMAAGGLWTTPSDLGRFIIAIQDAKARHSASILPGELIDEMLTPQAANGSYGLGFQLDSKDGHRRFLHLGDDEGFVALIAGYTETGHGVAVMTNSDKGLTLASAVVSSLVRSLEWPGSPASALHPTQAQEADIDRILGIYESEEGLRIQVIRDRDEAQLLLEGQAPIPLRMLNPSRWFLADLDADLGFEYGSPSSGKTAAIKIRITQSAPYAQDIVAPRVG